MYDFFVQSAVFLSLGVVLYLVAKALPRISDNGSDELDKKASSSSFVSSSALEKADALVHSSFEKILRRLKVIVLKADNFITTSLGKIKSKSGENGGKDFPL